MAGPSLRPHVHWAQRHRELYLRVELSDVRVPAPHRHTHRHRHPGWPLLGGGEGEGGWGWGEGGIEVGLG